MYVVMGATGHVGAAVADALLDAGEAVTVLTRAPDRAAHWRDRGAAVQVADAGDTASLRHAFRRGRRAFLLNPPADPAGDTDAAERRTVANILAALDGAGLEKVVAASTYGAQAGEAMGDLATLWLLEEGLRAQPIPAAINRGAYYMTNWTALADTVRTTGVLPSMFPANTVMPMVAPRDLGRAAAARLLAPLEDTGVRHVEGPARYTPRDVADAFAAALGRDVSVEVAPRARWTAVFRALGFSDAAARSYAGMTAASLDGGFGMPADPERGPTTLAAVIAAAAG
jgi:uncharacterized protein YbjT (DUF2867 family)